VAGQPFEVLQRLAQAGRRGGSTGGLGQHLLVAVQLQQRLAGPRALRREIAA
jgi:hypothetical protein